MFFPLLATWKHPELFVEADSSSLYWSIMLTPVFRIFEFFAGISLCSLQKHFEGSVAPEMRSRWGYRSLAFGVALFACGIGIANHVPLLAMSNGFMLPAFSLAIFGLVNIRGWLALLLSHKWMVILGESSFAVYLLHNPIWDYFDGIHPVTTIPMWLLYCATVLAASIGSFFWLERPMRRRILGHFAIKPLVVQEQEQVVPTSGD
jgi:peptidoglycan/LPS O-acetylase OafA/YrhL